MGCGGSMPGHIPIISITQQSGEHGMRDLDNKIQFHDQVTSDHETDSQYSSATPEAAEKVQEYVQKYPAFAKEFRTIAGGVGKLRQLSEMEDAFHDKSLLSQVNREVLKLRRKSTKAAFSPGSADEEMYHVLADFIVDIDAAGLFCQLAEQLFECFIAYLEYVQTFNAKERKLDPKALLDGRRRKDQLITETLNLTLLIIQNFAEYHQGFCDTCTNTTNVISLCLARSKQVENISKNFDNSDYRQPLAIRVMGSSLNILYNMARKVKGIKQAANNGDKQTLVQFAKSDMAIVAPIALLSLAYMVDEESNYLITADKEILGTFTSLLKLANESPRRKFNGFSAKELAEGLSHLAINDTNKKVLAEKGAIPILVSMLRTSNDDGERASGAKALWMLAFDEDNREAIMKETGALDILRELQHSDNPAVQKPAAGALWELEGKQTRNAGTKEVSENHVMISYQWDAQQVLIEVKNRLQANGYRVWMDLEQMGGSTLESMAKAVENASVVLVCVSQRYKESPNCRSEAEYAYQLRKDIIPLMVQRNYTPDGWLGMIVGTKLWIDFRNNHVVETGAGKLIKELGERGRDDQVNDVTKGHVTVGHTDKVQQAQGDALVESSPGFRVSSWTRDDVECWLKEIGLDEVCKKALPKLDGQTLIYLHELREECPDYYYKCLEGNLNLHDMFDVFKFREELNKLMRA